MPMDLLDTGLENDPFFKDIEDAEDDAEELERKNDPVDDDLFGDEKQETGFGTNTIISSINKLPTLSSDNIYDTILVNVATIVRNNTTKDRTVKEIRQATEQDIKDLITCICNYHENMSALVREPKAIFYLPEYTWLPGIHARPLTGNRKIITDVITDLIKEDNLLQRKRIRSQERNTMLLEIYAGGGTKLPYKTIVDEINEINKLGRVDPRSQLTHYLIISHAALDYHFMLKYRRTTILESFTGKFIKPKILGYKVFGTNFIPFNSVTHLIFGDKTYVMPMAKRKNRKLLTDMAKRQQWYVRTPSEIAKFVGASGQIPEQILTHLKL